MADEEAVEAPEEPKAGPGWLGAILMGVAGLGGGFGASMALMPNTVATAPSEAEQMEEDEEPPEIPVREGL